MARLIDLIMTKGVHTHPRISHGLNKMTWPDVPIIVADNVADYYYMGSEQDMWEINRDFPTLAPPFDKFWVEFRSPRFINKEGVVCAVRNGVDRVGFLVEAARRPDGSWFLIATMIAEENNKAFGPYGILHLSVSPDGSVQCMDETDPWLLAELSGPIPAGSYVVAVPDVIRTLIGPDQSQVLVESVIDTFKPVALAISFMHRKNVTSHPVEPPAVLSKKWNKKHGRPLVRYHVLDIDPMRKVLRDEGGAEETGIKKALHICRGHFATYTVEKPLFGRVTGTFWKPQHVRGSAKHGAVVKDYNVKAPRR